MFNVQSSIVNVQSLNNSLMQWYNILFVVVLVIVGIFVYKSKSGE